MRKPEWPIIKVNMKSRSGMFNKISILFLSVFITAGLLVACGSHSACASTLDVVSIPTRSSGGFSSGSSSRSSGSSSSSSSRSSSSSSGTKSVAPSNSGTKSTSSGSSTSGTKTQAPTNSGAKNGTSGKSVAPSNSGAKVGTKSNPVTSGQRPSNNTVGKNYDVKLPNGQLHVYVHHTSGYYNGHFYDPNDPFYFNDPWNPHNWSNPRSPFFGGPPHYIASYC